MRDYGAVHTQFWWSEDTGNLPDHEQKLALYLLTTPYGNITGVIRLTVGALSGDLKWSEEKVKSTLTELFRKGFISINEGSEWVVINNHLKFNPLENPNQVKAALSLLKKFPKNIPDPSIMMNHLEKAVSRFSQEKDDLTNTYQELKDEYESNKACKNNPSETVSKPLGNPSLTSTSTPTSTITNNTVASDDANCRAEAQPSPDEDDGDAKDQIPIDGELLEPEPPDEPPTRKPDNGIGAVRDVFAFWQTTMDHPQARLDDKRKRHIRSALKMGYSVNDLKSAILGCSLTPHNIGFNDRNQRYDGLHLILRSADQIDRFIRNAKSPPLENRQTVQDKLIDHSTQEWAERKKAELRAREQETDDAGF